MRILVTGGAGFIGSHIVDALISLGYEVAIVDNLSTGIKNNINEKAKFYKIDIKDKEKIEKVFKDFKPDILNHHAAQVNVRKSHEDPIYDAENNIIGSVNVFFSSVKNDVKRIIFASSGGAIYGNPRKIPVDENAPIQPISPYGVSKYCIEIYLNYFKRLYGIERVILRYANVYGPRQNPISEAGVISIFSFNILNDREIEIYGSGNQTRDFIYVEDVVKANLIAINGKEGVYNIGTGKETSIKDIVGIFSKILNKDIRMIYKPERIGEVYRIALDVKKAKKELNFKPEYDLESGIRKTLIWFLNRLNKESTFFF